MTAQFDFDLHGLASVRLIEATESDAAVVEKQLGFSAGESVDDPDIVIRFVDKLDVSSQIRYLEVDDVGFTDDAFLILRSKHKSRALVQIPFDRIGERCEIVCERGLIQVPLLIPILNLSVLKRGVLPLHAAAFSWGNVGWVATGWSKGGKTETLLSFMENGAEYVGDEWVYLTGDGERMYGIPEPIRLWKWHLDHLPRVRVLFSKRERAKLSALGMVVRGIERWTGGTSLVRRSLGRAKPLLRKQLCVDASPYEIFGRNACRLSGVPNTILFVVSHESPEITVQSIEPDEIAQRMLFSLQYEYRNFLSYYQKFCFAFPNSSNDFIESFESKQRDLLGRVLARKRAYEVCHPYPVAIPELFETITKECQC